MATTPKRNNTRPESWGLDLHPEPPVIRDDEPLVVVMQKLFRYLVKIIDVPHTFEELRSSIFGHTLSPLIDHIASDVHHQAILPALLALRGHFRELDEDDDRHLSLTRAYACEIVAWRFVTYLSEQEAIDYLLYELPVVTKDKAEQQEDEEASSNGDILRGNNVFSKGDELNERSRLLGPKRNRSHSPAISANVLGVSDNEDDFADAAVSMSGLNALEVAAVCDAKRFLSQKPVQRVVHGLWSGDIVFWETLSVESRKKPRRYNKCRADPYTRLRVPKYLKIHEAIFFAVFLGLYYAVLIERNSYHVTAEEVMLMVWLASFAYDEFGQYLEAGTTFYAIDFWSAWDAGIVTIGVVFLVLRVVGLAKHNYKIVDTAFDILSLEALLLVPRICSLLSLIPFFGVLIPCLKEMAKFSTQFLGLVFVIYGGFLTTFTLLARDQYTPKTMSYMLLKIFFGSSYLGFDAASNISPILGFPLMILFVWLTNILLITCLISLISNKMNDIMLHAREEYLFLYSVYVLEASTSNKLTYYYPPFNLLALLLRPLRLFVASETLRHIRIVILKVTHAPHVAVIQVFERLSVASEQRPWIRALSGPKSSSSLARRSVISRKPKSIRSMKSPPPVRPSTLRFSLDASKALGSPGAGMTPRRLHANREAAYNRLVERDDEGEQSDGRDKENTNSSSKDRDVLDNDELLLKLAAQVERLQEKIEDLVEVVARQQDDISREKMDADAEEVSNDD